MKASGKGGNYIPNLKDCRKILPEELVAVAVDPDNPARRTDAHLQLTDEGTLKCARGNAATLR
jgi:hypothetical protein